MPDDPTISLVSLGCAKNTVDSECLLGNLLNAGLLLAEDPAESDICLVNTCGFIEAAREETAATLNRLARLKRRGRPRWIVAIGCMVERAERTSAMRPVLERADACFSFADYPRLPALCRALHRGAPSRGPADPSRAGRGCGPEFLGFLASPRARIGPSHSAYLKIAEGCSNRCAYCAIPGIRGPQVSRPMKALLDEARQLLRHGAREINLIAQDTANYGQDRYGRRRLDDLLRRLDRAAAGAWIRLLYAHPRHLDDAVIRRLVDSSTLCPYLDLPLQHIADPMLRAMGRGLDRRRTIALLKRIRAIAPDGALRTTFIVGFPGETRALFHELLAFVRDGWFDHAGVFAYSPEPGTPAALRPDSIPVAEKEHRRAQLLEAQRAVSREKGRTWVGRTVEVLVEGISTRPGQFPRNAKAVGRTRRQAPEVDGAVFILPPLPRPAPKPGDRCPVTIAEALDYDLLGRIQP